jgi:hypothetical protein
MSGLLIESSRALLALWESPFLALRRIRVEETDSEVVIEVRVPSYHLKQQVQEAVLPTLDGRELVNRVIVTD